jgi:hypothetical protein
MAAGLQAHCSELALRHLIQVFKDLYGRRIPPPAARKDQLMGKFQRKRTDSRDRA